MSVAFRHIGGKGGAHTGSSLGAMLNPWRQRTLRQRTLQGLLALFVRSTFSKLPQKLRAELDAESDQANRRHTSGQQATAEVAAKPCRPGVARAYSAPQNLPGSPWRGNCGHLAGGNPATALTGAGTPPGSAHYFHNRRTAHLLVTTSLPLYGDFVKFSDC